MAAVTLIALGATAFTISYLAAQPYPGVTVDSGEYLAVSEGLIEGDGFTMPYVSYDEAFRVPEPGERVHMTQFPPLYPMVLAATQQVTGLGRFDAVRLLGSSIYLVTMLLAAGLVLRATKSLLLTVVAGALMLAPELVTVHSMAWSEGLMILSLLAALHLIVVALRPGSRWALAGAGLMGALASLARFVGVAVILAAAIVSRSARGARSARSWARPAVLAAMSLVPVGIWFAHNIVVAGVASEKDIGWHPPSGKHLVQALQTVGGWVVPNRSVATGAGGLLILVALVLCASRLRMLTSPRPGSIPGACLLLGFCYASVVVVSRVFLDQNIPLDPRILAPLQILTIVAVCAAAGRSLFRSTIVMGVLVVLAVSASTRGAMTAIDFSSLGVAGYTNDTWRNSETLEYTSRLDPETVIVTNAPDPLWLWQNWAPMIIPPRSSLYSGQTNRNYSSQLAEIRDATRCREGIIIFFKHPTRKPARSIDPLVVYELGLTKMEEFEDAVVYDIDEPIQHCLIELEGSEGRP